VVVLYDILFLLFYQKFYFETITLILYLVKLDGEKSMTIKARNIL